jgi:hypothetical protein
MRQTLAAPKPTAADAVLDAVADRLLAVLEADRDQALPFDTAAFRYEAEVRRLADDD